MNSFKFVQWVLAVMILGLAGVFIYHFSKTLSIGSTLVETSQKVEDNQQKLVGVEDQNQKQGVQLDEHERRISANRRTIEEQRDKLSEQEESLRSVAGNVEKLEQQLDELEKDAGANRDQIEKLRHELAMMRSEYQRRVGEMEKLRERVGNLEQRDAEVELRLRALEKVIGIERPQPLES